MTEQPPGLPPSLEDIESAQPDEEDAGGYTRADYEGWWERAAELHRYIQKVPESLTDKVDMTERKNKLVFAFDQLSSPGGVADPVSQGTAKQINSWIEHAEGFVGFLLQSYEPAVPATQVPILVTEIDADEDWRWPWIEGWDNPKRRKKILKPPSKDDSQIKRVLIGGAVLGSALYFGKRFMEKD